MDLTGYVPVSERLRLALAAHPDLRVVEQGHRIEMFGDIVTLVCSVAVHRDAADVLPVVGSASESLPGRTPFTRGSELMVGFTSALGRALGYMGFGLDSGMASRDEVSAATAGPVSSTGMGRPGPRPGSRETAAWVASMPDEPPPPGDPGDAYHGGPRSNPPTPKMVGFAHKLAAAHGIEVPADALTLFDACKQFIEAHK